MAPLHNQSGVVHLFLLVLIVLGLMTAAGWYIRNRQASIDPSTISSFDACVAAGNPILESYPEQCAAGGRTFMKELPLYVDTASIYKITYPEGWRVEPVEASGEGQARDWIKESQPIRLRPDDDTSRRVYIDVLAGNDDVLAEFIRATWRNENNAYNSTTAYNTSTLQINGNAAQYTEVQFVGDNEQYTDHQYLITKGSKTVFLSFREFYNGGDGNQSYSAGTYLSQYARIVQSVRFLN